MLIARAFLSLTFTNKAERASSRLAEGNHMKNYPPVKKTLEPDKSAPMKITAVARTLGVSRSTVYDLIHKNLLKAEKPSEGRIVIREAQLNEYLRRVQT